MPSYRFLQLPLGQANPWDDAPPPPEPAAPRHPMSFSDLQKGLQDYSTGKDHDNSFRNGALWLLLLIALVALIVHARQARKTAGPPDSIHKLGRELGRLIRFPLGTRFYLQWVARSTHTPFASLLLSAGLFDKCVKEWSQAPTFSVARHWGTARLARLRPLLFQHNP